MKRVIVSLGLLLSMSCSIHAVRVSKGGVVVSKKNIPATTRVIVKSQEQRNDMPQEPQGLARSPHKLSSSSKSTWPLIDGTIIPSQKQENK